MQEWWCVKVFMPWEKTERYYPDWSLFIWKTMLDSGEMKCMCMFKACSVSPCNVCNNVASWIKVDVKNSAF